MILVPKRQPLFLPRRTYLRMRNAFWMSEGAVVFEGAQPVDCNVCPCAGDDCNVCADGTSTDQYDIVLSGISCTCGTLNGTYRVTRVTGCLWEYDFGAHGCDALVLQLQFFNDEILVQLFYTNGLNQLQWNKFGMGSDWDCGVVNESIPLSFENYPDCDGSASTCLVTAV